jgi:hypothetical protein
MRGFEGISRSSAGKQAAGLKAAGTNGRSQAYLDRRGIMEDRATARIVGLSLGGICFVCMMMAALGMT